MIPAASTNMRLPFSGKAEDHEASTYGRGMKTMSITPISWTSPPNLFTA